jgi:hypothetical protein
MICKQQTNYMSLRCFIPLSHCWRSGLIRWGTTIILFIIIFIYVDRPILLISVSFGGFFMFTSPCFIEHTYNIILISPCFIEHTYNIIFTSPCLSGQISNARRWYNGTKLSSSRETTFSLLKEWPYKMGDYNNLIYYLYM